MARTFLDRMSTLLKADAHGVVDALEERSLLLKQHLREAELAHDQHRARLGALQETCTRLTDALTHAERELADLDQDVQRALDAGKDDLARFAVRRLLPRRTAVTQLKRQLAERSRTTTELAERVTQQKAQLEGLRLRVRAEVARERSSTEPAPAAAGEGLVTDEEIELELIRRRAVTGGAA